MTLVSTPSDHTVCAYRYALLPPIDWQEDCDAELRRCNALWNRLVEIERAYRDQVRAVAAADPVVAGLQAAWDAMPKDADRETRARLAEELKAATAAAYKANRPRLRELDQQRQSAVKEARQASGLHWGNYNAVIQSYETARQRAMRDGAELHFRGWDGTGRITQQIIGGMSAGELEDGSKSQVQLGPNPNGRGGKVRGLTLAIFTRDRVARCATWPIVWHRDLPDDARIQQVTVHRRRQGPRERWHVVFSLRVPGAAPSRRQGTIVAVNPGWRQTPDGVRVGTALRKTTDLDHVYLPPAVLHRLQMAEDATSERDRGCNDARARLAALDKSAMPEALAEATRSALHPQSGPRALYRLLRTWRSAAPSWQASTLMALGAWQQADRQIWYDGAEHRRSALALRREHYRLEARRLLARASELRINAHNMSHTALATDSDLPAPARAMRVAAAPSELRDAMLEYARKVGIVVTEMPIPNDRCACGAVWRVRPKAELAWSCAAGHTVDQDANYCRLMLERPDDAKYPAPARKAKKPDAPAGSASGRWQRLKEMRARIAADEGRSKTSPQPIAGSAENG